MAPVKQVTKSRVAFEVILGFVKLENIFLTLQIELVTIWGENGNVLQSGPVLSIHSYG